MSPCGSTISPASSARSTPCDLSWLRPIGARPPSLTPLRLLPGSCGRARANSIFLREQGRTSVKIVRLEGEIDFEGFRHAARAAAARGVGADAIRFVTETAEREND